MKSHWVEYKGKRVLIAEYSNYGTDTAALREEAEYIIELLQKEPLNSVLSISNVSGTNSSLANAQVLMSVLPNTNHIVRKRCVVGASGIGWGFVESFNRLAGRAQIKPFRTIEEALDWIVQD